MSRSAWKIRLPLIKSINLRAVKINPALINKTILIPNGKIVKSLIVNKKHIGFTLGEFSLTKISPKFKNAK